MKKGLDGGNWYGSSKVFSKLGPSYGYPGLARSLLWIMVKRGSRWVMVEVFFVGNQ